MPVVIWLLAVPHQLWSALSSPLAREVLSLLDTDAMPSELAGEVLLLRSQVEFLLEHAGRSAAGTGLAKAPACSNN